MNDGSRSLEAVWEVKVLFRFIASNIHVVEIGFMKLLGRQTHILYFKIMVIPMIMIFWGQTHILNPVAIFE